MMRTCRTLAFLLLPLAAACGDGAGGDARTTVRDSAGIEIVSNARSGAWSSGEQWTVAEDLRIGSADGDEAYQFGAVAGIDIGSDGTIYVLDQQASEVRVFSPGGEFVRRIGRPGSGPGELSQGAGPVLVTRGDTILVPDAVQQRVSRFDPEGTSLGSFTLPMAQGFAVKWMETPDQDLVQQAMIMAFGGQQDVEPRNLLLRRDASGEIRDTLAQMPAGETMDFSSGQPRMTIFAPEPMWTLTDDGRLITGNNAFYRFRVHDRGGEIRRIVEKQTGQRALTESDEEEFRRVIRQAWQEAGMPPQAMEVMSQGLSFAAYYPAYANLMGGPDGSIWVQAVQTPEAVREQGGTFDIQDLGAPDWDVFDSDGRYLGVVSMPARFTPLLFHRPDSGTAADVHLYGVLRDDLDVQHVTRLVIERGAATDR